ncbi:MAG: YceD family protein [Steroidobacteraceae bacterium]
MPTPWDQPLDAYGLARSRAVIEREFSVGGFARLRDRLAELTGSAAARIEFRFLEGLPAAELHVEASVVLVCQRCLGPVRRKLESVSPLVFADEDAPGLPPDYEPVGGDPRKLDLTALVEDELLLSLPLIAQHEPTEECKPPGGAAKSQPEAPAMRRPFAGLKDLLKH